MELMDQRAVVAQVRSSSDLLKFGPNFQPAFLTAMRGQRGMRNCLVFTVSARLPVLCKSASDVWFPDELVSSVPHGEVSHVESRERFLSSRDPSALSPGGSRVDCFSHQVSQLKLTTASRDELIVLQNQVQNISSGLDTLSKQVTLTLLSSSVVVFLVHVYAHSLV